jgi:hypothetical protein
MHNEQSADKNLYMQIINMTHITKFKFAKIITILAHLSLVSN